MASTAEIEQRIDSDLEHRCRDNAWGNFLCFVLTALCTDLVRSHLIAMIAAGSMIVAIAVLRAILLTRREWFVSLDLVAWRKASDIVSIVNGFTWGLLAGYLAYVDGYYSRDVLILLLYFSAVAAAAAGMLLHDTAVLKTFLVALYGPLCVVQIFRPHEDRWGPLGSFFLYTLFLALKGERASKEYMQRLLEAQALARIAKHDFLTGLPNRFWFQTLLEQALARAPGNDSKLEVFFIDLNGFKIINDSMSHQAGDLFLRAIAEKIVHGAGADSVVGRLGGDEFAVFVEGVRSRTATEARISRILQALQSPALVNGRLLKSDASIGISSFPNDARDASGLLRMADHAMYVAKREGGCRFRFASDLASGLPELHAALSGRS